jgi:thiol-disulfide isomerase/thioredoxin
MKKTGTIILALILVLGGIAIAQEKLLPSKAYQLISDKVDKMLAANNHTKEITYRQARRQVCLKMLPQVQKQVETGREAITLLYIFAGAGKAKEMVETAKGYILSGKKDWPGVAGTVFPLMADMEEISAEQMRVLFKELGAEKDTDESWKDIAPSAQKHICRKMIKSGQAKEVLDMVNTRLAKVDEDGPQGQWDMVRIYLPAYDALGEPEKGEKITLEYAARLRSIADKRQKNQPENAGEEYETKTGHLRLHADIFESNVNARHIVGSKAPDMEFTHFLNSKPFKFEDLRGKVVVIDFFATWCGPCVQTLPHMRKFYDEYKPQGVAVIGVTGFQGIVVNHGEELAKTPDNDNEAEVMKKFVAYQKITWPLVFSTRGCNDIKYGVSGIPTLVVIDKKGVVRLVSHPDSQSEIRAMVDKLLAE